MRLALPAFAGHAAIERRGDCTRADNPSIAFLLFGYSAEIMA
jgi:hypothetical protein